MPWRSYIAPPDDPNGNAGKLIWTDDQGHFQVGGNNPETPTAPPGTGTTSATPTSVAGSDVADILKLQLAAAQANQASQIAYNNAVLELQRQNAGHQWGFQQEQLAQAAAHDAWQKSVAESGVDVQRLLAHVQEGLATGTYNGAPTLQAQEASGYLSAPGGSVTERAQAAYVQARDAAAAAGRPFDGRATREYLWQTIGGLTPQAAQQLNQRLEEYQARTGTTMPVDLTDQNVRALGGAAGTPTLAREQEQNRTGLGLLNLASQLRGPDNAFAYANTLASVPESMRQSLNQMMARSGISYGGPSTSGLGGVAAQIGAGNINGQAGAGQMGPGTMNYQTDPTAGMMVYDRNAAEASAPNGVPPTGTPQMPTYTGPQAAVDPNPNGQMGPGRNLGPMVVGANGVATHAPSSNTAQPQHIAEYSPTDWNNTNTYTKRLLLAGQEAMGRDKDAEMDEYQRRLPKYTGPRSGRIAA